MVKRLVSGMLLAFVLSSCGDDGSGSNPAEPVSEMTSSSSVIAEPESSSDKGTSSIKESSSSIGKSSSSSKDVKPAKVSSSSKVKEALSSSKGSSNSAESSNDVGESSSSAKDSSSSSEERESSSSNVKTSSSSAKSSSSSAKSSSSRSKSSSSSKKIEESSSSERSSSSSKKIAEIKPNDYYKTNCPEGVSCKYVTTEFLNQELLVENKYGEILDERDGNVYKTIEIGTQTWIAQNMNYDTTGFCYDDVEDNCEKYGKIYNANVFKYVCPFGWHVPDSLEFHILIIFAQEHLNLTSAGSIFKSQSAGWFSYSAEDPKVICETENEGCVDGNGTDEFGFSAIPLGKLPPNTHQFETYGKECSLWYSPQGGFSISYRNGFGLGTAGTGRNYLKSVRCIKD